MSEVTNCVRRGRLGTAAVLSAGLILAACSNAGEDRVLSVPGDGVIAGVVYLDLDASRTPGPADQPLAGVHLRLLVSGTRDTMSTAVSGADGVFSFGLVPTGQYTVMVPAGQFGDSISVVRVDTSAVALHAADSIGVNVAVSYPKVGIEEARALPLGTKVFVDGVALNFRDLFGDTVVHVQDTSAAIRVTAVQGPLVTAGDSIRVLGRLAARDGQPVLERGQVFVLAIVSQPVAEVVSTAQAATADGGRLDAALVRVVGATIGADTSTNADGDYVMTVNDDSGDLTVVFDQDAELDHTPFVPGAVINARGLLVPGAGGGWRLKPRSASGTDPDVVLNN